MAGKGAAGRASGHDFLHAVLRVIEIGFNTIPMTIATVVIAALLLARKHRRAAIYTVGATGPPGRTRSTR